MTLFIQILLTSIILVLATLTTVAGFQVFHILHEFRLSLQKLNKILDNTHTLSEASAKPVTAVNEFFAEVKTLVNQTQDELINATPDRVVTPPTVHSSHSSLKSRFFHRSGLPLRSS